jgi:hypothetical protein
MSARRAAATFVALAAVAAAAPWGCTSGDDPCVTMVQHIEDCDAQMQTQAADLQNLDCEDPQPLCVADCISDAPCDQVKDLSGPKGKPIQDCIASCGPAM